MASPGEALQALGLVKSFGGLRAVDGVSFVAHPGERLAIIGPNGAGKTTLLNLISGYLRPDAGLVRLFGRDITRLPPHRTARLGLVRSFQTARVFNNLSVETNVEISLICAKGRMWSIVPMARSSAEEARLLLQQVGIDHLAHLPASALAHGDRKRLELAIVMAQKPAVILLDEPTAGVALDERRMLMEMVLNLAAQQKVAVAFIEHDMDVVFGYAHRIMVMDQGTVIADGPRDQIAADPRVQEVYLAR